MSFRCNTILQSPRPAVNLENLATKQSFGASTSLTWRGLPKPMASSSPTCLSCLSAVPLRALAGRHYKRPSMLTADAYAVKRVHQRSQGRRSRVAKTTDTGASTPSSNADVGRDYRLSHGGTKPCLRGLVYRPSTTEDIPSGRSPARWACPCPKFTGWWQVGCGGETETGKPESHPMGWWLIMLAGHPGG